MTVVSTIKQLVSSTVLETHEPWFSMVSKFVTRSLQVTRLLLSSPVSNRTFWIPSLSAEV